MVYLSKACNERYIATEALLSNLPHKEEPDDMSAVNP
ncbi:MAG: hypothetical protein A4E49_02653 [Methanosaeta sp. PtaU1.Bin112]|nr:MAG: hypothetical protein A4E49_02653 [Methanosaeta sp. PtaU1.Bin112]